LLYTVICVDFCRHAQTAAAADGETGHGIPGDVISPSGQGEYRRDVIISWQLAFEFIDIRLRGTAGRDFLHPQTTPPDRAVAALPCDARRPIAGVALPSRDFVAERRHVCDVTTRRQPDVGVCYL